MKVIADTNVFIAVALNEPEKARIIRLTEAHDLSAPDVLPFEIGNALSAMLKRRILSAEEVIAAWDSVNEIPVELCKIDIRYALEVASQKKIYAYDAYFVVCALQERVPLITLDRRLEKIARELNIMILE